MHGSLNQLDERQDNLKFETNGDGEPTRTEVEGRGTF